MNTHILSLTALALTVGASQGVTITYVDAVVAGMSGTVNTPVQWATSQVRPPGRFVDLTEALLLM